MPHWSRGLPPRRIAGPVVLLLGSCAASPAMAAPAPADLAAAAIRRLGLQAQLPTAAPPPAWSLDLGDWLLLSLGAVALVLLAYLLKDLRWHRRAGDPALAGSAMAPDALLQPHVATAEQFARQGRYAEAMHELLLQGLGDLRARAGGRLADSLTSREVLRRSSLPEQARAALRAIVQRVEWTWFGAHEASLADYRACREAFDTLHAALRDTA